MMGGITMDQEKLCITWETGHMELILENFLFFPCPVSKLKKLEKIILEDENYPEK